MTLRRTVSTTVLAAALTLGCTALPTTTVSAAPAAPSFVVTGGDPLAGYANYALDAWMLHSRTGSIKSLQTFDSVRDAIAGEAARRLGLSPSDMRAAWRRADRTHQLALLTAFTQLGTKYKRNSSAPGSGFDCSGLTSFAWGTVGAPLARQSRSQINAVKSVTRAQAQAGDLAYYPGHVMIYLGIDNAIIHAPFSGRNVEVAFFAKSRTNSVRFGNPLG